VFENVTVKPSPLWLRYRLEALGMNSISNIVDVTNYVMAAIAQPMHAFDAEKLHGGEIIVRSARDGEQLPALNGETYTLDSSNLVIADPEGAVALAGVIGGAGSAISDATTRIVLESANFSASSIRRTSTKIRLRTDASAAFRKSARTRSNTIRGLTPGTRTLGASLARDQARRRALRSVLPALRTSANRAAPGLAGSQAGLHGRTR
jgi:phenylalanyl-tRNA synthetase beta chain